MTVHRSAEVLALLREASHAQMATLMSDRAPRVTQVWIKTDNEDMIVSLKIIPEHVRELQRG